MLNVTRSIRVPVGIPNINPAPGMFLDAICSTDFYDAVEELLGEVHKDARGIFVIFGTGHDLKPVTKNIYGHKLRVEFRSYMYGPLATGSVLLGYELSCKYTNS